MSEAIAEMVIPGTYIEVRAEGLIGVGGIATGNIGIVGTAARGPIGTVVPLGGLAEAIDLFGPPDAFATPAEAATPLTLVRALEQVFAGGARNVFAVRIANGDPVAADGHGRRRRPTTPSSSPRRPPGAGATTSWSR